MWDEADRSRRSPPVTRYQHDTRTRVSPAAAAQGVALAGLALAAAGVIAAIALHRHAHSPPRDLERPRRSAREPLRAHTTVSDLSAIRSQSRHDRRQSHGRQDLRALHGRHFAPRNPPTSSSRRRLGGHDSGLCATGPSLRRRFASDLLNLTLAAPEVNRCSGACGQVRLRLLPNGCRP